ncbi:MAG TPA: outer membrane beta-barrel protein [Acidobacteriaceae bacterium]|nr:outer membrane beta-barrel protein [Acidobacteriaceae bacterium]
MPNVSQSQVVPAIKGGGSQINIIGLYSLVNPDGQATLNYPQGKVFSQSEKNRAGQYNQGGAIGADFRLGRFVFGQPALAARFTFSYGNFANESTYMFGPELHYTFNKLRPYGDFLIGKGNIDYKNTSFTDDSIVYEFGGGLDYHLNRRFNARLVDFQYQFWNLSSHTYPAGLEPGVPAQTFATTLRPYTLSFGLTFRVR